MPSPKRILVTGAAGFVGQALGKALVSRGDHVLAVVRDPRKSWNHVSYASEIVTWEKISALKNIDAIVHLAGENVAQRWTSGARRKILSSRVETAASLLKALPSVRVFVSASAIGIYGDRGDTQLDEQSKAGTDFLAGVCLAWEKAAHDFAALGARVTVLRFGMVLGKEGGALAKMLPPFRMGVGGPIGTGEQWMSWIHLDDLVTLLVRSIDSEKMSGTFNAVAPEPLRNSEFTTALAESLSRPARLRVPAFALRLGLGEMSSMLLGSQRVIPKRLLGEGFSYRYPRIIEALRASVNK